MENVFAVTVSAGSLRSESPAAVSFPHRWTEAGIAAELDFTGGQLLNLAAAGCVANDLYREAAEMGVVIDGVRITAQGSFDDDTWQSSGIEYVVDLDSPSIPAVVAALIMRVDEIAEIPRALRQGVPVTRAQVDALAG